VAVAESTRNAVVASDSATTDALSWPPRIDRPTCSAILLVRARLREGFASLDCSQLAQWLAQYTYMAACANNLENIDDFGATS
jgi:hypothetical protein